MQNNMKEVVVSLLKKEIPSFYYYHNYEHTLYVTEKVIEIGMYEGCSKKEIELLTVAALWHDTGLTKVYKNHEEASCVIAEIYLKDHGYSPEDIAIVCNMIMATKVPQSPKNKLEEILADADLEYLGTASASIKAAKLFQELHAINPSLTIEKWDRIQISFLQKHHYFTNFCKEKRAPGKLEYLKSISVS